MKLSEEISNSTIEALDLETWGNKVAKMEEILAIVGYPRHGTPEEAMNEWELAKMVQDNLTLEELTD